MKKKFCFLFCFILLLVLLGSLSVCYASVDYTYFKNSTFNSSKISFLYEVVNEFLGFELYSYEFVRDNDNTLKSNLIRDINNYSNFFIVNQSKYNNNNLYGKGIRVWLYNNDFSSNGIRYNIYYTNLNAYYVMDSSSANSINVNGTLGSSEVDKFLYINNKFYNSVYNQIVIENDLTFIPNQFASIVNYRGSNVYIIKNGRSVSTWNIGSFDNFKDFDNLEVWFGPLQWSSGDEHIFDLSQFYSVWDKGKGILNGNSLILGDNGGLSIYNNRVYYDNLYSLYYTYEDNGDRIDGDYYYFYFKVPGSDNSINQTINPDSNTNLDVNFINAFGNFLEDETTLTSGDISYLAYTLIPSGDLFSGDLAQRLGFEYKDNNKYDMFIYNIYRHVLEVLAGNGDYSITINYRGFNKVLKGSDFYIPNDSIRFFIRMLLLSGFIMLFYQQFHNVYIMVGTADLSGIINNYNHKHTFFM